VIFSVKECHDLETGGRGLSRSLKMVPFDRSYTTFYWSVIVNAVLFCIGTILSYLTLNNLDLEMWVIGYSGSFKLVPFESLGAVSFSPSIVTMSVSLTVYEIFSVKEWHDLKNGLGRSFNVIANGAVR